MFITANGFVPTDVAVPVGDTVSFTKSDAAAHQVDFKGAAGVTCSDPNRKGTAFRGSVTVSAPSTTGSATIAASARLVVSGTTKYTVAFGDGSTKGESPAVPVQVRPKATLKTGVVMTPTYAGTPVPVQRRNSTGGWTTIRTVTLGQSSTATFTAPAPSGTTTWRTYLQASQAGSGYEPGYSRTVRVVR